jgi:hypothetical protein
MWLARQKLEVSWTKQSYLPRYRSDEQKNKPTYNSRYSLVVTHLTTNLPVRCLNRAERTGSLVFNVLWSYVEKYEGKDIPMSIYI